MASAHGIRMRPMATGSQNIQMNYDENLLSTRSSKSESLAYLQSGQAIPGDTNSSFQDEALADELTLLGVTSLFSNTHESRQERGQSARAFSSLSDLPTEILVLICKNLDAIWVYNLSHVSSGLFDSLNGPDANHIWYSILPRPLWRKRERYQLDSELNDWATIQQDKAMWQMGAANEDRWRLDSALADSISNTLHFDNHRSPASAAFNNVDGANVHTSTPHHEAASGVDLSEPDAASDELSLIDAVAWTSTHFDLWMSPISPYAPPLQAQPPLSSTFLPGSLPMYPQPTSSFSMFDVELGLNFLPEVRQRRNNLALGGPYQPLFSYKREIVGHLSTRRRCQICFTRDRFYTNDAVGICQWGLMWCEKCLASHTIEFGEVKELVRHINRTNIGKRFTFPFREPFRALIDTDGSVYFLASQISNVFAIHGCGTVKTERASRIASAARQEYKNKRDNAERRHVRNLIVAAAEKMWEGQEPLEQPVQPGMPYLLEYRQVQFQSSDFAVFRERFAPTERLKHFLFPPYLLSEEMPPFERPIACADLTRQYPPDPLDSIHLKALRHLMNQPAWIAWQAGVMLKLLTDFRSSTYKTPGSGGSCTTWKKAAREYHRRRLEAKLDKAIRDGDLQPFSYRSKPGRSTIAHRLRIEEIDVVKQAGLSRAQKQQGLRRLFAGPSMFEPYKTSVDMVYQQVAALREQEMDFDQRLRYAKRILLSSCKKCPANGLNVNKKGIEAILSHMRDAHPEMWWCQDDWYLFG